MSRSLIAAPAAGGSRAVHKIVEEVLFRNSSLDPPPTGGLTHRLMRVAFAIFMSALMALSGAFAHAAAPGSQAGQHREMMSGENKFSDLASSKEIHDQGVVCCEAQCAIAYGYLAPFVCQTTRSTFTDRHALQKGDAIEVIPSSFDPPPPRT